MNSRELVQQVINKVMLDGKKCTAESSVYEAMEILGERTDEEPVEALENSVKILTHPRGPLPPRRRCRRPTRCPSRCRPAAPAPLAVRWLVEFDRATAARRRWPSGSPRADSPTPRSQQGLAYKRKDDIYRMAQANKAFAHYHW